MTKFLLVKIWSVGVSLLLAVGTARNGEFKYFEMCCQLGLEAGGWRLVLQKVPSEDDPKVRNHGEGPY